VIGYLRNRGDIDEERIGLWGDSLAPTNGLGVELAIPLDADPYPERGEPLGGITALLAALYEPNIQAIYVHGGLLSYAAFLEDPFVYQPSDSIIRGILKVADLPDIAAALAPLPLRMECLVDGINREVSQRAVKESNNLARAIYHQAENQYFLSIQAEKSSGNKISEWFLSYLL